MTNINFTMHPLSFRLDLLSVDPNDTTSICCMLKLYLSHPTGNFSYQANDIWFDTTMWDSFMEGLSNDAPKRIDFFDQSQYIFISIEKISDFYKVTLSIYEPLLSYQGGSTLKVDLTYDLDEGFTQKLLESFKEFPKYW